MNHSIAVLRIALETARNNEPILRAEGKIEEADSLKVEIEDLYQTLARLHVHQSGYFKEPDTFEGKVARAINHHSFESGSNTPDFVLASFLSQCLKAFDDTITKREDWFKPRSPVVDNPEACDPA
jgi:hypothetical protein